LSKLWDVKPTVLLLSLALSSLGPQLQAQTATHRTGITFSVAQSSGDISVRRLFGNSWAGLADIGLSRGTAYAVTTLGASADVTSWSAALGARRYFGASPLRPFAELGGGIRWNEIPGCRHASNPHGTAGGGVEYSVAPRVSIEGSAGLAYTEITQRCTSVFDGVEYRYHQDALSTFRTALSITFYF
jgi:hypothetical protein